MTSNRLLAATGMLIFMATSQGCDSSSPSPKTYDARSDVADALAYGHEVDVLNADSVVDRQPLQADVAREAADGSADLSDVPLVIAHDAPLLEDAEDLVNDAGLDSTSDDATMTRESVHIVYVSEGGDDFATGVLPEAPVRSVRRGIEIAQMCVNLCEVHVAAGTYKETDTLVIPNGMKLFGGYLASDFTRGSAPTTISVPTANTVMLIQNITKKTVIDGVTLTGANLATVTGGSTYVVRVSNSNGVDTTGNPLLAITNSTIVGGQAGPGANGAIGVANTCSQAGGLGGGSDSAGTNASSGPGVGGGPGDSNQCSCSDPGSGGPGHDGQDGAPGVIASANGDTKGAFSALALWTPAKSIPGNDGVDGTGGGGGGGGGRQRQCAATPPDAIPGARGGDGGRGGCGGGRGLGGVQGGGSFGIVLVESAVDLTNTTVKSGSGGKGGDGGKGADGLAGTPGQAPSAKQKWTCLICCNYWGGAGGKGGNGRHGGGGSGGTPGNGGPAIALAKVGTSTVVGGSFVASAAALAGTPGAGGLNPGTGTASATAPAGSPGLALAQAQFDKGN